MRADHCKQRGQDEHQGGPGQFSPEKYLGLTHGRRERHADQNGEIGRRLRRREGECIFAGPRPILGRCHHTPTACNGAAHHVGRRQIPSHPLVGFRPPTADYSVSIQQSDERTLRDDRVVEHFRQRIGAVGEESYILHLFSGAEYGISKCDAAATRLSADNVIARLKAARADGGLKIRPIREIDRAGTCEADAPTIAGDRQYGHRGQVRNFLDHVP